MSSLWHVLLLKQVTHPYGAEGGTGSESRPLWRGQSWRQVWESQSRGERWDVQGRTAWNLKREVNRGSYPGGRPTFSEIHSVRQFSQRSHRRQAQGQDHSIQGGSWHWSTLCKTPKVQQVENGRQSCRVGLLPPSSVVPVASYAITEVFLLEEDQNAPLPLLPETFHCS